MDEKHPSLETLEDLVRIQSVNPFFSEGAKGEQEVADYVEQRCRQAGLEVYRQSVFSGRENVVAELRVGRPETALLFEAHMDTVSLGSMENPLEPTYVADRLYGRGTSSTASPSGWRSSCCAKGPRSGGPPRWERAERRSDCPAPSTRATFRHCLSAWVGRTGASRGRPTSATSASSSGGKT